MYLVGHTIQFPATQSKPKRFVKEHSEHRVENIREQYLTMIYGKVKNKEIDLVVVSNWDFNGIFIRNQSPNADIGEAEFLQQFYYVEEKIRLSLINRRGAGAHDLHMRIWRPKH